MPPAISESDSESADLDTIPAKAPRNVTAKAAAKVIKAPSVDEDEASDDVDDAKGGDAKKEEEEDEDEGDDEEEEYVVEKIVAHDYSEEGVLIYNVKWMGYEKVGDRTWEPTSNLDGAKEALKVYHDSIGGVPSKTPPAKAGGVGRGRGKRKSTADASESPAPAATNGRSAKKAKVNGKADVVSKVPVGLWETELERITTIEEVPLEAAGNQERSLRVLITFTNGHKGAFPMATVRQKCPQKLLDYYENHLSFKDGTADT